MSLIVAFPNELGVKVQEAAALQGLGVDEYVITAVQRALTKKSLDEILAPARQQFADSGMTEDELTALVKEERRAMWRERRGEQTP